MEKEITRETKTRKGLKPHVVAGRYVVLLGWHLPEEDSDGLMGFSIHRTDHTVDEAHFLCSLKVFGETDPSLAEMIIGLFKAEAARPGHRGPAPETVE